MNSDKIEGKHIDIEFGIEESGKKPGAVRVLEASLAALNRQAKMHDKPDGERSMGRIVAAFNAMTGHHISERDGWFFMVLLKMARATTPGKVQVHDDDFIDGAAYFALASEAKAPSEMDRMVAAVKRDIGG